MLRAERAEAARDGRRGGHRDRGARGTELGHAPRDQLLAHRLAIGLGQDVVDLAGRG